MSYYFNTDFVIDYDYVDKTNKLTYKGFLKYLCDAGSRHSDEAGYGLKDFNRTHLVWLVLNWKLKIYKRPLSNEKIHITTWSSGADRVCSYRDYKMFNENNELICIATSKWALYDLVKGSLAKITSELIEAYHTTDEHIFENVNFKLREPDSSYISTYDYNIMRRDIDTNNHVHNSNYLDIVNEVLPENIYENLSFENIEVMYKSQALYGNSVKAFYYDCGNEHIIVIKSEDLKKLHCIIKLS